MQTVSLSNTAYIHSREYPDILRGRGAMITAAMGGVLAGLIIGPVLLSLGVTELSNRVQQAGTEIQQAYETCALANLKIGFGGAGSDTAMFLPSDCRPKP